MLISAIVATDRHNVIGKDNEIPWYLPADLSYFKRVTLDHHIIMGRGTFRSIGRPLPKRTNIVITRDPFFTSDGVLVAHSVEEALNLAYDRGESEAFIIGGGQLFRETAELWDRLYLTEVGLEVEGGDTFFPALQSADWQEIRREEHQPDAKNEWSYTFRLLERLEKEHKDINN